MEEVAGGGLYSWATITTGDPGWRFELENVACVCAAAGIGKGGATGKWRASERKVPVGWIEPLAGNAYWSLHTVESKQNSVRTVHSSRFINRIVRPARDLGCQCGADSRGAPGGRL